MKNEMNTQRSSPYFPWINGKILDQQTVLDLTASCIFV